MTHGKEEKRVIDYNQLITEKIEKLQKQLSEEALIVDSDGFVEGIQAESVEMLVSEDQNVAHEMPKDMNYEQEARNIIDGARAEADTILNKALQEAEQMKQKVFDEAKSEGYEQGKDQALAEMQAMRNEIEYERVQLEQEYQEKMEKMEPELVEVILKVFSGVTKVLAEDKKDMVLHLINNVMTKTEISRDFIIRVSKDDYRFLLDNKQKIYGAVSKDGSVEIVEDPMLRHNECMIETDGGVFDCSFDIQLGNLINSIKTLSYSDIS